MVILTNKITMESLTVTKISEPKTINYTNKKTGKPDSFQKVGFQCSEYGDRWHDFTFRGNHGLAVGNKVEVELTSREYNGKTYWDAKLPKKSPESFSPSLAEIKNILNLKVVPMLVAIQDELAARNPKEEYPEYTEENDAHGL